MTKEIFKQVLDDLRINFVINEAGYIFTYNNVDLGTLSKNPFLIHFYSSKDLSRKLVSLFTLLQIDVNDIPDFLGGTFAQGVSNREYMVSIITIKTLQEIQRIKRSVDVPKSVQLMYEDVVSLLDPNILQQLDALEDQRQRYLKANKISDDAKLGFKLKTQLKELNKDIFMNMEELEIYMQYRRHNAIKKTENNSDTSAVTEENPEYQQLADTLMKGLQKINPQLFDKQDK